MLFSFFQCRKTAVKAAEHIKFLFGHVFFSFSFLQTNIVKSYAIVKLLTQFRFVFLILFRDVFVTQMPDATVLTRKFHENKKTNEMFLFLLAKLSFPHFWLVSDIKRYADGLSDNLTQSVAHT